MQINSQRHTSKLKAKGILTVSCNLQYKYTEEERELQEVKDRERRQKPTEKREN